MKSAHLDINKERGGGGDVEWYSCEYTFSFWARDSDCMMYVCVLLYEE